MLGPTILPLPTALAIFSVLLLLIVLAYSFRESLRERFGARGGWSPLKTQRAHAAKLGTHPLIHQAKISLRAATPNLIPDADVTDRGGSFAASTGIPIRPGQSYERRIARKLEA